VAEVLAAGHVVTRARIPHVADVAPEEAWWYRNGYGRAKRRAEVLLGEASEPASKGRPVPVVVVRPGCTGGCSTLPGAIAPPGWVNKGNMHVPQSYYFYSTRPDPETPPRMPFLPAGLEDRPQHLVPVDVASNIHVMALVLALTHPQRWKFGGAEIPVFNACPDHSVNPVRFWDNLALTPHFREKDFEFLGPRTLDLLRTAVKSGNASQHQQIQKKMLRPFGLIYGMTSGGDLKWEVETDSCSWLASQMHPKDREEFPVIYSESVSWREWMPICHEYFWRHIVRPRQASLSQSARL